MNSCYDDPWIAGAAAYTGPELGILGSVILATTGEGEHGRGLLYNDVNEGDEAKLFALRVTAAPAWALVDEDGSVHSDAPPPDGSYSITYDGFADGAFYGTTTSTIAIGSAGPDPIDVVLAGVEAGHDTASFSVDVAPPVDLPDPIQVVMAGVESGHDTASFSVAVGQVVPGGQEPVTVEEAALAARVDAVDELRDLIEALIAAAREQAEHITGRTYKTRTTSWTSANWPVKALPVKGVTAAQVRYWDGASMVPLDPSAYVCTAAVDQPGTLLAPALGTAWLQLGVIAAGARVEVDLTIDVSPASVPQSVKTYIKAQVGAWLKSPEALTGSSLVVNPLFERLLDAERVFYR